MVCGRYTLLDWCLLFGAAVAAKGCKMVSLSKWAGWSGVLSVGRWCDGTTFQIYKRCADDGNAIYDLVWELNGEPCSEVFGTFADARAFVRGVDHELGERLLAGGAL